MWSQVSLLFVSDGEKYRVEQNPVDGGPGLYFPGGGASDIIFTDSIAPNAIFGTSYGFLENDGHCCPSIEKRFRFDYNSKKRKWE